MIRKYFYNLATDKPPHQFQNNAGSKRNWCGAKFSRFIVFPIKAFLSIFSFIYGLVVRILIFLYRLKLYQLSCKVISVGNITLGGTGKTSLVEFIARYLKQQGHKVAILTRGYKRKITSHEPRATSQETMGDEPYMLFKKLGDIPVVVDANRIRAAKIAIKDYAVDSVILDDGFQQWQIKKDLEIVTVDATEPFGNGYLIPRGILREPISSLKRSDVIVLTKTNLNPEVQDIKDFLSRINPPALIIESIHRPLGFYKMNKSDELLNIDILKGKTVTLVSGIADPDSFENLIISLGINMGLSFRFPDHYSYLESDLEKIIKESKNKNIDTVITTEKDAVRLSPHLLPTTYPECSISSKCHFGIPKRRQTSHYIRDYLLNFLVLHIEIKITRDEQEFLNRLLQLYNL